MAIVKLFLDKGANINAITDVSLTSHSAYSTGYLRHEHKDNQTYIRIIVLFISTCLMIDSAGTQL